MDQITKVGAHWYQGLCGGCQARDTVTAATLVDAESALRADYAWWMDGGVWKCGKCTVFGSATELDQAEREAYDLETVERFEALATSLFEQKRLARPILQAAYRAVEHSRAVLAHDWLMEFGAELDSQISAPGTYEAL